MKPIEIARTLARLNETVDAVKAYTLALQEELDPDARLEAAAYILQFGDGEDYKISYTVFRDLYNQGVARENILEIMDQAFYLPNVREMKAQYERNCKVLAKYPYIFRKDFPAFEDLPLRFYPYDDNAYTPYDTAAERFGEYVDVRDAVIRHNFFHDLENPILAKDVYSQYELEYLQDNVRASEDVARENHIYVHYTSWPVFCSYLTCLNWKPLLDSGKFVFLFGEEISRYPIDFKEEFGVDYSKYTLRPVRVREITRLIWHTQLSTHNGGDFFNQVFDAHPNLLCLPSVMLSDIEEIIRSSREGFEQASNLRDALRHMEGWPQQTVEEVYRNRNRTDKDILVGLYINNEMATVGWDRASRIAPAIFFQPHFPNMVYSLHTNEKDRTVLTAENYDQIRKSTVFQGFKYIKTFTPLRRFTTSHAATVRFMYTVATAWNKLFEENHDRKSKRYSVSDAVLERVFNRSFMIDPHDKLYHDSILVRYEDGKRNPKATLTALAAFLDLPYSKTMEECTEGGKPFDYYDGFDPNWVFRTYDEFANDNERRFIEYFLRDAYEYYGYDFNYYDGAPVDAETVKTWVDGFDTINTYIAETERSVFSRLDLVGDSEPLTEKGRSDLLDELVERYMKGLYENRIKNVDILMRSKHFVNPKGQPLYMMPRLELDPALLERPLYH